MITRLFRRIYKFIDKFIVVPISRAVYYLSKKTKKGQGKLDKILNRPNFLIYLSLVLAVLLFVFIDLRVINLVETDAEVITDVPVEVKYNEEAYVIEGVPETVDITITGRKSDIYLAKQLGNHKVILDLTNYTPRETPYKVNFTYSKSINSLNYKLDPSYVQVTIKNKESQVKSITSDLLNINSLDSKLSVKSVTLSQSEVVIKGGSDALKEVASVKALIDLGSQKQGYKEAGTYDIDDALLVAYDSNGNRLDNIEIVPGTISASIVLDSYSVTVPLEIKTTGNLVTGKSIASVMIDGKADAYTITIYGDKDEIENITSVPVAIDVDGLGNDSTKTYNTTISKPNGVRMMSTEKVTITLTFGEEKQKTLKLDKSISPKNLADNLSANFDAKDITVQVKGVSSVIDSIESVSAYVDLANLGAGEREVDIKIDSNSPLVTYVVSSKLKVYITEKK